MTNSRSVGRITEAALLFQSVIKKNPKKQQAGLFYYILLCCIFTVNQKFPVSNSDQQERR